MKAHIIFTLSLLNLSGLMASGMQNSDSQENIYGPPASGRTVEQQDLTAQDLLNIANLNDTEVNEHVSVDEIVRIANLSFSEVNTTSEDQEQVAPRFSLTSSTRTTIVRNYEPLQQALLNAYGLRTPEALRILGDIALQKKMTISQLLGMRRQ
jgi:hypothetical protein